MPKHKVHALIQARMGSKRCPGKMMMKLAGVSVLEFCIERARKIVPMVPVGVVTGSCEKDDVIYDFCRKIDVFCFRGPDEDVLARYYSAALHLQSDHIIRLTGDNPLFDYRLIGSLLKKHIAMGYDYSSNKTEAGSGLPEGIGAEIISTVTLEKLNSLPLTASDREHVNDYILRYPDRFNLHFENTSVLSGPQKISIDTMDDYIYVKNLIESSNEEEINMPDYWKTTVEGNCC